MNTNEKIRLVQQHQGKHGLSRSLEAIGLAPGTWYYREKRRDPRERDHKLKQDVIAIIKDHPDYGYRRIVPELRERIGRPINHKRVRRVLKTYQLGLRRSLPKHRKSALQEVIDRFRGHLDLVNGYAAPGPMDALSTDFTELIYAGGQRKAHLMAYVDIESKLVPGWALVTRANTELALNAWKNTMATLAGLGRFTDGLIVHSDQDSVYRSHDYLEQLLVKDDVRISYSERGCKDNPWIESFWGRMKTEIGSQIVEAETMSELRSIITKRITYYNTRRRHSMIGNQVPLDYLLNNREDTDILLAKTGS